MSSSYWRTGTSRDLRGVAFVLVNLNFGGDELDEEDFVIVFLWNALVVLFATLTLTWFTQSTIVSSSGMYRFGGLSVSTKRIHHGSTGTTVIPGGPRIGFWLISFPSTAVWIVKFRVLFNRLVCLKITNPSGWMAAYINKIEKQNMTRKINMRTKMANKLGHVCLELASR